MWIEEQANGKFKYCERYKEPLTGKTKKVAMIYDKKGPKAEKIMRARLQEKIDEKLAHSLIQTDLTIGEAIDKWLDFQKNNVKFGTYEDLRYIAIQLQKEFANLTLQQFSYIQVNNFLLKKSEQLKYSTLNKYKIWIKSFLKFCIDYGYYTDLYSIERIKIPKGKKEPQDTKIKLLERDEIKQLLDTLKDYPQEQLMIQFMLLTGVRFGEMIALTLDDIDFNTMEIDINKTFNASTWKYSTPKTGISRKIKVNQQTINIINQQRVINFNKSFDKKIIFSNTKGGEYNLTRFNHLLKRYHPSLSSHTFRHTFISFMLEKGITPRILMEHTGHTDTKMIDKVYSHVTKKMKSQLTSSLNDLNIF